MVDKELAEHLFNFRDTFNNLDDIRFDSRLYQQKTGIISVKQKSLTLARELEQEKEDLAQLRKLAGQLRDAVPNDQALSDGLDEFQAEVLRVDTFELRMKRNNEQHRQELASMEKRLREQAEEEQAKALAAQLVQLRTDSIKEVNVRMDTRSYKTRDAQHLKSIDELQAQIESDEAYNYKVMNRRNRQIEALETTAKQNEDRLKTQERELTALRDAKARLEKQLSTSTSVEEQELNSLWRRVSSHSRDAESAKLALKSMEKDKIKLVERNAALQDDHNALQQQVQQQAQEVELGNKKIEEVQGKADEAHDGHVYTQRRMKDQIATLTEEGRRLGVRLESANETVDSLTRSAGDSNQMQLTIARLTTETGMLRFQLADSINAMQLVRQRQSAAMINADRQIAIAERRLLLEPPPPPDTSGNSLARKIELADEAIAWYHAQSKKRSSRTQSPLESPTTRRGSRRSRSS